MQNPAKVRGIFSSIAARYDLANHLLSGGLDFLWRARAVRMVKKWHPQSVLDLATGSGDLALAMQKAMPQAHIIGADATEMIAELGLAIQMEATYEEILAMKGNLPILTAMFFSFAARSVRPTLATCGWQ